MSQKKKKSPKKETAENFDYALPQDDIIHTESFDLKGEDTQISEEEAQAIDPNTQIVELQTEIDSLNQQLEEQKDRMLRLAAEAENIKRRADKEKADSQKYAISNFAKDMVEVADNLTRALSAIPEGELASDNPLKSVIEGVEMTNNQLQECFARVEIKKVSGVGSKFSYDEHQAVSHVEHADHESGTIIEVFQEGYKIHDRLLRPAMVVVAK